MSELVHYEVRDRVAVLTIDNPPVNALGPGVWEAVAAAVARASADPGADAAVLIGAGATFVAGADINAFKLLRTREDSMDRSAGNHALLSALEDAPKPLVAAIHGNALGGGLELAMACHYRVAAKDARVGQPEVNLGIIPGAGGTQRLPRIVGLGRAKEMILTGARWDAARALSVGLVSAVVPQADLARTAREWADRVLALGPLAVRLAKASLNASSQMPLAAGLAYESAVQAITFESQDKQEGTTAFLEKRKPQFRGE
jgi:enoyl-CoA hydratase